jgi:hypothetical protein
LSNSFGQLSILKHFLPLRSGPTFQSDIFLSDDAPLST